MKRDEIMRQWDQRRAEIANGDTSSAPRDWFESIIDDVSDDNRELVLMAILNRRITPASDRDCAFNAGVEAAWSAAYFCTTEG